MSLAAEISRRIGRATSTMGKLSKRVWENNKLTTNTKTAVYTACVLTTLLYGSETWTTYSQQEQRLNTFHLRCLRRILHITWQDRVPNEEVLERANTQSMFALLSQRRLRWLGHVHRMEEGRLPKDVLYGELAVGSRPIGRPMLRFKDVCKRDLKAAKIDPNTWETAAKDRSSWRLAVKKGTREAEDRRKEKWQQKRERRKARADSAPSLSSPFTCEHCDRDCLSRIGLFSHTRRCSAAN